MNYIVSVRMPTVDTMMQRIDKMLTGLIKMKKSPPMTYVSPLTKERTRSTSDNAYNR